MPFTVTMPKLSPTMEGGTIVKWHVQEGDFVEAGALLIEVATDKATVEYNALDEGYLRKIVAQEGGDVRVNEPIAIFSETEDESLEGYEVQEPPTEHETADAEPTEEKKEEIPSKQTPSPTTGLSQPSFVPLPPPEQYAFPHNAFPKEQRLRSSPLARKIAEEKGLDISTVQGTGPGGRVTSRDLDFAESNAVATFSRQESPNEQAGSFDEVPLTPMRKAIGERLQASKTFIPHFYVQQEVDAAPLIAAREQLKANGVKVTFNDFIVRATALALRQHPGVNTGFNSEKNTLIRFKTIDISIAVSLPDGLITPIVRHADYLNLGQISSEVKRLAQKAKSGKLMPEEYQGGSFTISNLGMYGINDFQAVINPPQSAILAVGGMIDKPVVKGGRVVPGKVLTLSLSSDHRVVDGADAAQFLKTIQKLLESPSILLI